MGAHKQRDAQASLQQVDLLVHCRRGDEQLLRRSSLLRLVALAADVRPLGQLVGYEALKFYCNEGLVPCVKRDANNHHIFDEHDVAWISSLTCLKKCGMSIEQMKAYLALCPEGENSIPQRQQMLARQREKLPARQAELQKSLDFIDRKQQFYEDVLAGRRPYVSYLTPRK